MYISGHLDIIKHVLSNVLFKNYFQDIKYENFTKKNLYKGLIIVDLPCDSYYIKNKHIFSDMKICKTISLLNLFNKDKNETVLWQRHKGYFAHLHAMSTDPDNTVIKIRNKIIISILGYSLLALYDKNVFDINPKLNPNSLWIGVILHIITDSYSKVHTIRDKNVKTLKIKKTNDENFVQIKIHEIIKNLSKEKILLNTLTKFINKIIEKFNNDVNDVNNIKDAILHINKNKIQLYNSYKGFRFEFDTIKLIDKFNFKLPDKNDNIYNYGDIITFQYYENQPFLLHNTFDFMVFAKQDNKLYKRMIDECTEYLILYKNVIINGNVKEFLEKVLKFLLEKTFHIQSKYLDNKTNKIYYDEYFFKSKDIIKHSINLLGSRSFI